MSQSSNGKSSQGFSQGVQNQGLMAYQNAQNVANQPFQSFDPSTIAQYESPYTQQVIDAGDADLTKQNNQTLQGNAATATHENAYGGDRAAVADSLTNNDFANQKASFDANTRQAGFGQAENTAMQNWQMKTQYPFMQQGLLNSSYQDDILGSANRYGTQNGSQSPDWGSLMSGGGSAMGGMASLLAMM
jgi:hypothetical protein